MLLIDVAKHFFGCLSSDLDYTVFGGLPFAARTMKDLPDGSLLWHYTSTEGFVGIIKNQSIWASDIRYMNDPTEVRHTFNSLYNFLRGKALSGVQSRTMNVFGNILDNISYIPVGMNFLACFSTDGNRLSQWRAYGGSKGYSVGFDPAILEKWYEDFNSECSRGSSQHSFVDPTQDFAAFISPVEYNDRNKSIVLQGFWHACTDFVEKNNIDLGKSSWGEAMAKLIFHFLMRNALIFKDRHYSEENEYRLIVISKQTDEIPKLNSVPTGMLFRSGAYGLVPFYALRITEKVNGKELMPIRKVLVGPSAGDFNLSLIPTQMFYKQNGYNEDDVEFCGIPLRF